MLDGERQAVLQHKDRQTSVGNPNPACCGTSAPNCTHRASWAAGSRRTVRADAPCHRGSRSVHHRSVPFPRRRRLALPGSGLVFELPNPQPRSSVFRETGPFSRILLQHTNALSLPKLPHHRSIAPPSPLYATPLSQDGIIPVVYCQRPAQVRDRIN